MTGRIGATVDTNTIRADFDRIARCSSDRWDHNSQYHHFLLERVPQSCAQALDVGCGTGTFTRLLAQRADRVLALDLSPEMIRVARERSGDQPNIDFQIGDVLLWNVPPEQLDCIVSIATLHHLPLQATLAKLKHALRPGGALLVLDLFRGEGPVDLLTGSVAAPLSVGLKMAHNRRLRPPSATREAWAQHGAHDRYPSMTEVRQACSALLPGARVRRHIFWRYSIVWRK